MILFERVQARVHEQGRDRERVKERLCSRLHTAQSLIWGSKP